MKKSDFKRFAYFFGLNFCLSLLIGAAYLFFAGSHPLEQGWGMKASFALVAAAMLAIQWLFWRLSGTVAWRYKMSHGRVKALVVVLLLFVIADKGTFAWGTLYDSSYITRNSQLLPLYQPLRIRTFACTYLGVKLDNEVRGGIDRKYSGLAYPAAPLKVEPPAKPLNMVILVIDSMRAYMLTREIMPETWGLAEKASVFSNHYSGGNCTRFGIFSVFYGIYGNYWFDMLGERRGPVLLDVLKDQGYDLRLLASSKLSFPEFNKTCFVNVPRQGIYDEPAGASSDLRDSDITDKFIGYLKERNPKKPYFPFVSYDASHGSYEYPPGFEKFKPASALNLLTLNKDNYRRLFNKYKNSVRYDDFLIGRILKAVRETGGMNDTVILVSGDHGEPFFESGYCGHNQAYCPSEVRVPLVLYVPGRGHKVFTNIASHMDIPSTLLRLAVVKNPPSDYSSGTDLFDAVAKNFVSVSGRT